MALACKNHVRMGHSLLKRYRPITGIINSLGISPFSFNIEECLALKGYFVQVFFLLWVGSSLFLQCRGHGIM